ncbi:MAG TPA: CobD/CbiB family protein [Thiobacillus sp.]|nr:MAG: cobalamin biosynthesis protein CobD [Hydrogenophilales bacterium 28-61-11]OYZ57312.1 MAG: cobalamin biosynthesis protein CobD [Hydrogenophilales bacterium 16-61-112]OZA50389.1 MAG: cobalamin biosynthesis protein CobD [Hydrogenophilales bacterium 17-61-76]HQT31754.1 CobD/CbiB family protein [Thiobacillus sp.]HQT70312.1 CobD/CbiB family protein [Thiobacillus sp.]
MAFFTVLTAVALEHLRPLRQPLPHYQQYARFTQWLEHRFNANAFSHGAIAWGLAVVPLLLGVWLIDHLLGGVSPFLSWAWSVAVLYLTLGFKYFSDDAERVARLLRAGDLDGARAQLIASRGGDASQLNADEIARVTIEQVMAASHRQMFGVLIWFVLLMPFGPVGAVLFRTASILARRWASTRGHFGVFAQRAFHAINWLPVRLTGLTYAIAGNFEDATFCWRTQADGWPEPEDGVVLAAGAGAMGIRLGQSINVGGQSVWRPELGSAQTEPDADSIDSAVSMIWRGLVIWMVAGLLVVIAGWVT